MLQLIASVVVALTCVSSCAAQQRCNYTYDCMGLYRKCCNNLCTTRRFCLDYCASKSDCEWWEYCVNNKCTSTTPDDYCDNSNDCNFKERCLNNKCTSYCDCHGNERCENGKCVRKTSGTSFSTSSIVGFTAVVVIGSCIACAVYCGCARRSGRPPSQRDQEAGGASRRVSIPNDTDRQAEDQSNGPVHPGGPPPYESLEMLNRTDQLPPPPSYEEALRNSHNNLSEA